MFCMEKNPCSGGVANLTLKTDIIGPPASALAPKNTILESFDSNIPDPEREGAPTHMGVGGWGVLY